MSKLKDIYEVLECEEYPGLTVGNHVIKPGGKFTRAGWPYEEKALDVAVEKKRCKKISGTPKSKNTEAIPEEAERKKK